MGEIKEIDNLAIIEGTTRYSNNNKSVKTTIRIKGVTAEGKMDIYAAKNGTEWEYKKIFIRLKQSKEEIEVLE